MTAPIDEIKQIYFSASKASIAKDFERAIDLLKSMPAEEDRERAAVYMDGLAQMRSQWGGAPGRVGGSAGSGRKT